MKEQYLNLTQFKSMREGLVTHGALIKDTLLVVKDLLELNNTISTCLINLNFILYYFLLLNNCEYLIGQICQYHCNQLTFSMLPRQNELEN